MKLFVRPLSLLVVLCTSSGLGAADTLTDIYESALKNDATLKQAEATYRADLEIEKQARSVILPQISATGIYQKTDQETDGLDIANPADPNPIYLNSNAVRDTTTEGYTLSLSQQIFDLPAWFTFKSGKQSSKRAEAQLAFDQQNLILRVATAYFNVLSAQDNLEASKAQERANKRQLEQTQQRFDVGLIAITDVHEARARYDSTVVQRLTAEGALGTSLEALTVLTGETHSNLWLLGKDFPIVKPDPISRSEWVQFALKQNYSLKAALYGMDAANKRAKANKMQHLPKVQGSFQYRDLETTGISRSSAGNVFSNRPPDQGLAEESISINVTMPIFTGGRISSQRRQAYEQYNVALQQKIQTQRSVIQNTRASHIDAATNVERVKARAQAIISTSSALDATQAGYEVGTRNIVDVLDAQRRLYSSITDYANARYDYIISMLKLKLAAGILSPEDVNDINKWMVEAGAPEANQYQKYLNK